MREKGGKREGRLMPSKGRIVSSEMGAKPAPSGKIAYMDI
jgi:hypothetical protein